MKKRKVLITGGGGFLGRAIAERCLLRGDEVWSLSRRHYPELEGMGVRQIRADVSNKTSVLGACKNKDAVFHLAAKIGSWGKFSEYYKINVRGTRNIIEGCRVWNVPVLVHTSCTRVILGNSGYAGGDESHPYPEKFRSNYAMSKAFAEQAVKKAADTKMRAIILRPHMIWGPGSRWLIPGLPADGRGIVKIGSGTNKVSGIYIDNAADAHILAADRLSVNPELSGRIYFVAQNDPIVLWDFIERVRSWSGKQPVGRVLPRKTAGKIGRILELCYKSLNSEQGPVLTPNIVNELSQSYLFDSGPLKRELGFVPDVTVDEGLERYRQWIEACKKGAHP